MNYKPAKTVTYMNNAFYYIKNLHCHSAAVMNWISSYCSTILHHAGWAATCLPFTLAHQPKNHNWKLPIFIIPFVRAGKDCAGVSFIKYPVSVPVKAFATLSNNTILFHIDSTWFFNEVRCACYCRFFPVHDGVCPVCFL
jgi:hypothetical protein